MDTIYINENVNTFDVKEHSKVNYAPLTNTDLIIPEGYIAVRFNKSNTSSYGVVLDETICETVKNLYPSIYWILAGDSTIYLFFKMVEGIEVNIGEPVLTVGGFYVNYITDKISIILGNSDENNKEIYESFDENLSNTEFLPDLFYPLHSNKNVNLIGLTKHDERYSKLKNHLLNISKEYIISDIQSVMAFINNTLFFDPLKDVQIKNLSTSIEVKKNRDEKHKFKNLVLIKLSDVEETNVSWIFEPYIPLGNVVAIIGDPGCGKSYFSLYLASILSQGKNADFKNATSNENGLKEPVNILILNGEDVSSIIRKRVSLLGGNINRMFILDENATRFYLDDITELETIISSYEIKLVLIDPIQSYMPSKSNMDSVQSVRSSLTPLIEIASQYECTFILIMHKNKNSKNKDIYRGLGSIDFIGLSRSVLSVEKKDNKTYVKQLKNSMGPLGEPIVFEITDNGITFVEDEAEKEKDNKYLYSKKIIEDALSDNKKVESVIMLQLAKDNNIPDRMLSRIKKELNIKDHQENKKHHWYIEPT